MCPEYKQCNRCEQEYFVSFLHYIDYSDTRTNNPSNEQICEKCIANLPKYIRISEIDGEKASILDEKIIKVINKQIEDDPYSSVYWLELYEIMKIALISGRDVVENYSSARETLNEVGFHPNDLIAFNQLRIICDELTSR